MTQPDSWSQANLLSGEYMTKRRVLRDPPHLSPSETFPDTVCSGSGVFVCQSIAASRDAEIVCYRDHADLVLSRKAIGGQSLSFGGIKVVVRVARVEETPDRPDRGVTVSGPSFLGMTTQPMPKDLQSQILG
jgi:hypothetical protein